MCVWGVGTTNPFGWPVAWAVAGQGGRDKASQAGANEGGMDSVVCEANGHSLDSFPHQGEKLKQ